MTVCHFVAHTTNFIAQNSWIVSCFFNIFLSKSPCNLSNSLIFYRLFWFGLDCLSLDCSFCPSRCVSGSGFLSDTHPRGVGYVPRGLQSQPPLRFDNADVRRHDPILFPLQGHSRLGMGRKHPETATHYIITHTQPINNLIFIPPPSSDLVKTRLPIFWASLGFF